MQARVDANGTFRFDDVAPGTYVFTFTPPPTARELGTHRNLREVVVPPRPVGSIRPSDLGTVVVR